MPHFLEEFDLILRHSVKEITNIRMSESEWLHCSLPVRMGGLGIRRANDVALPAFLACLHSTAQLVPMVAPVSTQSTIECAISSWQTKITCPLLAPSDRSSHRKCVGIGSAGLLLTVLVGAAEKDTEIARLREASNNHSVSWLHALPAAPLGTLVDRNTLRVAAALRLGSKMCHPQECVCGRMVDEKGVTG